MHRRKLIIPFLVKTFPLLLLLFICFQVKGQLIYTIGGSGYNGNVGNNGPAICAGIPYTSGVCLDGKGGLYLTCSNSIRKIDLSSGIITNVAGSDTYGHSGDGGPAISATLQYTFDVCMDNNNNLYITEYGGHYIRKINTVTGIITTVAGTGTGGYGGDGGPADAATLNRPHGIFCDASGNVYFADTYNSRVRKINAVTGIITTIAGTGATLYSGDGGPAINAGVPYPVDVSIDGSGNIYFAEVFSANTSRVRKIDAASGIVTTVAGNGNYAYSGDGGPATAASLFDPSGLLVDGPGNIYISEYDDSRIRKVNVSSGIINTIAGTGVNGFDGDGGQAIKGVLHYPMGLALDTNGDLYVADNTNHRIRKISSSITLPPTVTSSIAITASATAICPGTPVTFTAAVTNAGTSPAFTWQVNGTTVSTNPSSFTTSSLNNGDIVNCILLTTVCGNTIPVNSNVITITNGTGTPPGISIAASNMSICTGENVLFTATSQNAGLNPIYQWKLNGANAGTSSPGFSSTSLLDGDKISCIITSDPLSSCGASLSANSNIITMIVSQALAPTISIMASANDICPGTPFTLTAAVQNAGLSPAYQWQINGVPAGNGNAVFTYNNFADNDMVVCEVTPAAGVCSNNSVSSVAFAVKVKPLPIISLAPEDTIVNIKSQVQILASVTGSVSSFQWTPSSLLTNPNSLNPLTVALDKDAEFELTVTSADGCATSSKSNIKIFSKLFMPSAFTPNGDGLNDIYRIPPSVKLSLAEFSVYDRWGNRIFRTNDINAGWDGTMAGTKKDSGVFVFVISGAGDTGPVFLKGTFHLIR